MPEGEIVKKCLPDQFSTPAVSLFSQEIYTRFSMPKTEIPNSGTEDPTLNDSQAIGSWRL